MYIPTLCTSSIRWPPSSPSSERISHPLFRLGHPLLSGATAVEGIICDKWWSFTPFHMDVYSLCLYFKLAGQQPALVRSHKVVLAQYTVPAFHISAGFIGLGSTRRQDGHLAPRCEAISQPASSKSGQDECLCVCTSPCELTLVNSTDLLKKKKGKQVQHS